MNTVEDIQIKEFTVREVFEALKEDGFQHLRGQWQRTYDGKINGGCILGQGAINLGVFPTVDKEDNMETVASTFPTDAENIDDEWENREEKLVAALKPNTLEAQLNRFKNIHEKWLNAPDIGVSVTNCADAIMYWNDAIDHGDGIFSQLYVLATYEEVVEAAGEILAPYMEETVYLAVMDYSQWLPPKEVTK